MAAVNLGGPDEDAGAKEEPHPASVQRVETLVAQQHTSTPPRAPSSSTVASTSPSASSSSLPCPRPFGTKRPLQAGARTSTSSCSRHNPGSISHQVSKKTVADARVEPEARQDSIKDLFEAVEEGRVKDVQRLLDRGVDVNCRDRVGWTPLMRAAMYMHLPVMDILLIRGADAGLTSVDGATALHIAAVEDARGSCVHLLVNSGADVESRDVDGNTPLHLAVANDNLAAVLTLREGRACHMAPNNEGVTPLHLVQSTAMLRLLTL